MPARRDLDRRLRGADRPGGQRGGRLRAARRLALPIGRSFDERSGYRTKSMLSVPDARPPGRGDRRGPAHQQEARPRRDAAAGDARGAAGGPVHAGGRGAGRRRWPARPRSPREHPAHRRRSSALFDSFVQRVGDRDREPRPHHLGPLRRAWRTLTVGLAEKVDAIDAAPFRDVRFTRDQLQEIRYASLLHDFGKVGVREKVLHQGQEALRRRDDASSGSASRTSSARWRPSTAGAARQALARAGALARARSPGWSGTYDARLAEIDALLRDGRRQANEPTILEEESFRALMDLPAAATFADARRQPASRTSRRTRSQALSIRKGSLSEKERREIESHVTHTYSFLSEIPWTRRVRRVPEIAYAHHEKLDGTGYPRKLQAAEIPHPVADDDGLRHLRRARRLGPARTRRRSPVRARAGHPVRGGRGGKLDQALLDCSSEATRATRRSRPAPEPRSLSRRCLPRCT